MFEHFCATAIPGTIPANSTVTFNIYIQKTANFGKIYPYFKLWLEGDPNASNRALCNGTGAAEIVQQVMKLTAQCTILSQTAIGSQYFGIDVGYSLGSAVGNHSEFIKAYYEGTLNGNYDSTLVVPKPLGITSIAPSSGPVGTSVTITGTRFGTTQGVSTVKFTGTIATPTSWSDTSIVAPVPCGASTGSIVVTVNGVDSNGVTFTTGPCISGLTPSSGAVGTAVTISGQKFGTTQGSSTVTFNGTTVTPSSWSDTSIQAAAPCVASGPVVVRVNSNDSNAVTFTVGPCITNLSPTSGPVGTSLTISGQNFGATPGTSTVTFANGGSGVTGTPTSWSSTSIAVPVPSSAVTGAVVVRVNGTNSNGVTFTVIPPPSITSVSPTSGTIGTSVTISGTNFGTSQGSSTVKFNGTTATPTSWSDTSIVVPVPSGATSGSVVVRVGSIDSNGMTFTVNATPSISSLSPSSGVVGTSVTISGQSFGSSTGTVKFYNNITGTPTSWSNTSIVVPVPTGATTGAVTVTTSSNVQSNGVTFTVLNAPSITSLSPSSGEIGTVVTLTGQNFGSLQGASTVTFANGGSGITGNPTSWSNSSIVVPVPATAVTGPVFVTSDGLVSNSVTFTVASSVLSAEYLYFGGRLVAVDTGGGSGGSGGPPTISGFSPIIGSASTAVTITGTNFDMTPSNNNVSLNGVQATVTSATATSISTSVPNSATSGRFKVQTQFGQATSSSDFFVVPPGYSVGQVVYTGRISLGSFADVAIGTAGGIGLLLFDGTAGQRVAVATSNSTFPGSCSVGITILNPNGTTLVSNSCMSNGFIDAKTLAASGTYTVIIAASGSNTGTMRVSVYEVPSDAGGTITPGGPPVTVNIGTPGQNSTLTFSGTAGQRVSLRMSNVSIGSTDLSIQRNPTALPLTAGQQYNIQMEYYQGAGGSNASLQWSSPSTPKTVIPQGFLTPPGGPSGAGLKGDYYDTLSFTAANLVRTDPVVDFNWNGSSPGGALPGENWSARWTGQVRAQYSENYTFCTVTDDGVRLWVNGSLIIDKWVNQGSTEWCSNTPANLTSQWTGTGGGFIDTVVLPVTGTYTIFVDPRSDSTGNMTLTLYDVPADVTATTSIGGSATTVNIGTPGQNGAVTFSGTAGQHITVQLSGVSLPSTDLTIQRGPITLPLTAGRQFSIQMEYFQGCCGAIAKLKWSSPSTLKQVVPQSFLTPPGAASGNGLKGDYYANTTVSGTPVLTRTDPVIDFNWNGSSPGAGIPGENWSARWTGQVRAQYSEEYTFCTVTDDGVRLWVNGSLIVDRWVNQVSTEWCSTTPVNVNSWWVGGNGSIDVVLPSTATYTLLIGPRDDTTGAMTVALTPSAGSPPPQPTSISIASTSVPQDRCSVTTVGNGANMVLDVQYTFNNGEPITVYSWATLDSNAQYTLCTGPNEDVGTYRIIAMRNHLNSDWVLADAAVVVTPRQPTSLSISPGSINAGDCYVTTVGNGANMTIDAQSTYNGAPETVYGFLSLDGNGQATTCTGLDTPPGVYTIVGVRNQLNSEWVPVNVTLIVN